MSTVTKTRPWDPVEHLCDDDDLRLYIQAAIEEAPQDAALMSAVLGDVARARNIAELARETGIARETLYKTLRGEGNPTLATISKLANALGFRVSLVPAPTLAHKPLSQKRIAKKPTKRKTKQPKGVKKAKRKVFEQVASKKAARALPTKVKAAA